MAKRGHTDNSFVGSVNIFFSCVFVCFAFWNLEGAYLDERGGVISSQLVLAG